MRKLRTNGIWATATMLAIAILIGCQRQKTISELDYNLPRAKVNCELSDSVSAMIGVANLDTMEIHSIMVIQNGEVIYENWYGDGHPDSLHVLNSVSKTFTSIAVGMAINEGLLKLDDKIISFFPDKLPNKVSDNLSRITIRDLLTMTCGHSIDHTYEMQALAKEDPSLDWAKQFMSYPVEYKPGDVFCYNSVGTYMLSAILQKVSGKTLYDYLSPRLFKPLGIKCACWQENNEGVNYGGWGLYLRTEDIAKVGLLLLQGGKWNGSQIIPNEWINELSKKQVDSAPAGINYTELDKDIANPDWIQGYGYQTWQCRNGAFRADGAKGQFIIVLPNEKAVIAVTANTTKMQEELDLVWRFILPVLKK